MHWRIWLELYKDNVKIGSGVWHQRYTYKCNAIRAARKRFDKERVERRTGSIYTYKWVVCQTNPKY